MTGHQERETLRRASLIASAFGKDQDGKCDAESMTFNALASVYAAVLFIVGPERFAEVSVYLPDVVERIERDIRRELAQL